MSCELVLANRHHCLFLFIDYPQGQQEHRGRYMKSRPASVMNTNNLTDLSQWYLVCTSNNLSLSALLLCGYKKISTVHLNFPVEKKYADHNESKNMHITICLFSHTKTCASIRNVPFWSSRHHVVVVGWNFHGKFFWFFFSSYLYIVRSKGFYTTTSSLTSSLLPPPHPLPCSFVLRCSLKTHSKQCHIPYT